MPEAAISHHRLIERMSRPHGISRLRTKEFSRTWTLYLVLSAGSLRSISYIVRGSAPFLTFNMPVKSRFTRLDAFTKTVEDARIRTTSGGIVTIASLLVILYLVWGEWSDYRKVLVQPELIVDKGRGMFVTYMI